jgi:long-chain acyl-CoA synthetase
MSLHPWLAHYDPDVPADLPADLPCIPELFAASAERYPGRPALSFLNRTLSYRELESEVRCAAAGLAALGVRPGDRVAIQLPNLPQAVIAFQAVLWLGAVAVMTNPLYTLREVEHQWRDAGVSLAIVADFLWVKTLRPARSSLPARHYVVASIPEYLRFPLNWLAPFKLRREPEPKYAAFPDEAGVSRWKPWLAAQRPIEGGSAARSEALAVLQYTGGTTGVSKAAMLSHRNLGANVAQVTAWFASAEPGREVMLTALPLFHVFGLTVCMNYGLAIGAHLVLLPNPRDTKALVRAIAKHRVTLFPGVPTLFNSLNNFPGIEQVDVRSVKSCFSGSAPIAKDVLERFEALTGARIIEGFGMSETSPVTHVNPLGGQRKIGSVGIPVPATEARVVSVDDGHTELAPGQEGELVIRGPQVMVGYWQRPDETQKALIDGWMHTGDLAAMDEQGYFRIVGRMKDMINFNGMKVFPDEVDGVLMSHPKVLEAATIGVPDPERIESVKSFVVLRPGQQASAEELRAFCKTQLAGYKVPYEVEFLAELPKSSVLKILRRELRERELARRGPGGPR